MVGAANVPSWIYKKGIYQMSLEKKVNQLQEQVDGLCRNNSALKDDVEVLKNNYNSLVEGLNTRLEHFRENLARVRTGGFGV